MQAQSRWSDGIFLGVATGGLGASHYIVGLADGLVKARAIKPVAPTELWDVELLLAIKALPWEIGTPTNTTGSTDASARTATDHIAARA